MDKSHLEKEINQKADELLELLKQSADDEFTNVNNLLKDSQDLELFKLLRKLEGKFYKFAKIDYDREISIKNIEILLSYLNESEITKLLNEIEGFIITNSKKIESIFEENRFRFAEHIFLTQPEIFIFWFCIEKFKFKIDDNVLNDFSESEYDYICNYWGIILD